MAADNPAVPALERTSAAVLALRTEPAVKPPVDSAENAAVLELEITPAIELALNIDPAISPPPVSNVTPAVLELINTPVAAVLVNMIPAWVSHRVTTLLWMKVKLEVADATLDAVELALLTSQNTLTELEPIVAAAVTNVPGALFKF